MSLIHLYIPDAALHAAMDEQLKMAGFETAHGLEAGKLASGVCAAFIVDTDIDKKTRAFLAHAQSETKSCLFLLGEKPDDWDADSVTETFAKPIRLGHLLSRLQFYLNTAPRLRNTNYHFGPYKFIPQSRQIVIESNGTVIRLTQKETALLEYLGQNEKAIDRDELLAAIWGYDARIDTHTLETHIYQLRRKLDPEGKGGDWLINEAGSYRLQRKAGS